jgi:hypothetical protein
MDQLDYYAFLTADAKRWTDKVSPLSQHYVGHVPVYDHILPPVGFSCRDFIRACVQARINLEIPA